MSGFRGFVVVALVLATALAFHPGRANASPTAPTTVLVQVIGGGKVVSKDISGISCGEGDLDCYGTFSESSGSVTLKAKQADGWNTPNWLACPDPNGNECTIPLDEQDHRVAVEFTNPNSTPTRTLQVSGAGGGAGTVDDASWAGHGPRISCAYDGTGSPPAGSSGTCSWDLLDQSTVSVFAAAADGSYFSGWGGNCSAITAGRICSVYMTSDAGIVATFDTSVQTATLSVAVTGNGTVTGGGINCGSGSSCSRAEPVGQTIQLTADAADGYMFTGWSGACTGTQTTCNVQIASAASVTATFAQVYKLSVSIVGNGTVNGGTGFGVINCTSGGGGVCSSPEPANGTVTLTAVPAPGATFQGWSGACSGLSTVCTITMNTDRQVTATFSGGTAGGGGSTIPLTVSVTGSGSVTGPGISCTSFCTSNVTPNTIVTLTATPAAGATFNGWGGPCSGTLPTCTITVASVQTVTASFTTVNSSFSLSVTAAGNGNVTGSGISCGKAAQACTQSFLPGTTVTLTATPTKGAKFVRWSGDCVGTTKTCTLVMGQAHSVVATFSGAGTGGGGGGGGGGTLKSLAKPTVTKTSSGYRVTLRFSTSSAGMVTVQGLRAGRVVTSFKFQAAAGARTVGPFPVVLAGYYTFQVTMAGSTTPLVWHACLGRCGASAPKSAGTFTVTKRPTILTHAGSAWLVTLRFSESKPSGTSVRVSRSTGATLATYDFAPKAGNITLRRIVLTPGSYRLRLTATDAYGRVRTLVYSLVLKP
jgi:uncharacterized repeat protein (TIGR02543 family)